MDNVPLNPFDMRIGAINFLNEIDGPDTLTQISDDTLVPTALAESIGHVEASEEQSTDGVITLIHALIVLQNTILETVLALRGLLIDEQKLVSNKPRDTHDFPAIELKRLEARIEGLSWGVAALRRQQVAIVSELCWTTENHVDPRTTAKSIRTTLQLIEAVLEDCDT